MWRCFFRYSLCLLRDKYQRRRIFKSIWNASKKIERRKKMSQAKLSLKADISENQVYNIENGKNNPTLCTMKQIAKALDIDMKQMFDL